MMLSWNIKFISNRKSRTVPKASPDHKPVLAEQTSYGYPIKIPGSVYDGFFPVLFLSLLLFFFLVDHSSAVDSGDSRQTLKGIKGVYVLVEELQPNIGKFSARFNFSKDQLQKDVETGLRRAGIRVLNRDEWVMTQGRPVLYINVNTHDREKYSWAYDIRMELQQIASLEANPATKALVSTWSTNTTGGVNIGTLNVLNDEVKTLTDIFIKAYLSVNPR